MLILGANEDSQRIADLISKNMDTIDEIIVTLDSHHVRVQYMIWELFFVYWFILWLCLYMYRDLVEIYSWYYQ